MLGAAIASPWLEVRAVDNMRSRERRQDAGEAAAELLSSFIGFLSVPGFAQTPPQDRDTSR
jgi:hypothetical protein